MSAKAWSIREILEWTSGHLAQKGDEHPRLSAEMLLSSALNKTRVELYLNFDYILTPSELTCMHNLVVAREKHAPIQYIVGEAPFRHIVLKTSPHVLIPRPETELLVDFALQALNEASPSRHHFRVIEVGVGSGCIACSLAKESPDTEIYASDISASALALAQKNAARLKLSERIHFFETNITDDMPECLKGQVDVLISNPPYVPSKVISTLSDEVKLYEPTLALDGGEDGLDVFRKILNVAPQWLRPGAMFCVELFEDNVSQAQTLAREQGIWSSVSVLEDLAHHKRFLVARRKGDFSQMTTQEEEAAKARAAKIVTLDQDHPTAEVLARACDVFQHQGVVILPTDSVYGIGCVATPNNPAHERTFSIKHRDRAQTLPWLIGDIEDLTRYGKDVPAWAYALAERFWPGALTLVVHASDEVAAEYTHAQNHTIALRLPDSNLVRAICRELKSPLAITSANTHGQDAAIAGSSVEERLVDEVDLVLDSGRAPLAIASTIVDCTQDSAKILRIGAIDPHEIAACV